jgi:outer membrane protein OmpA-like peptidoglycan-associated protein
MLRYPVNPAEEFEELRRLLLSRERDQLRDLRDQITDKERRSNDVAAILPEAVKLSRDRGEELSRALQPAVEGSIKESIEKRPEVFVDALHPIIGPIVRRSIAESFRRLLQSLNQTLEHTFSWQGLKWRFEALRTGKSFAEVVMLRSLVYRVEQLFLIHRETSLSLLHVTADPVTGKDSDMVAGMLSAIQDFARDSFEVGEDSALEEFRVGQLQVWIAPGRYAYLAAVIRGNPSRELRSTLEETIESIHVLKGSALAKFEGDPSAFESLRPELESCLRSQYDETKRGGRTTRAWLVLASAAALTIFGLMLATRSEAKWKNFLLQLNAQPGLVVTEARKGWFFPSQVSGLRDASAADPEAIAREEKLDPARIRFQWKDYLALDPASVRRRFEQRFGIPKQTRIALENGVLMLSGSVPYEWLERVRREATLVPGIASVADQDAEVAYDPGLVLRRFEEKFGLPETAHVVLAQGVLTLSGGAPHAWLTRVDLEATQMPGITSVDERNVIDLDQRTFQQSKSVIESAFIYFLTNRDDIATEGFAALSRLPEEINRCANAAKQIGLDIALEIHGHADAVGGESKNADLRQRRADKVRDFLVSCGFESAGLKPIGTEEPPKEANEEQAGPEESERRVSFKIVSR